jgi:cell division protein FtsN
MGDEGREISTGGLRNDPVEGGFSILLGEESIRAFMSSGDFSSARELDRFIEIGTRIEGRMSEGGKASILAMSVGKNRYSRDFAVLQISHILAKHGKDVLIVDCDFLSPGLSGLIENTEDQGFLDLLLYGSSLKTVEHATGIDGVTVMGAGSFPVSRTIPFAKKEFTKVRDFFIRSHDVVIYCSTLYSQEKEINPLTSLVDSIFLTCRLEEMPEGQLQKSLENLGSGLPPADLVCFGDDGGISIDGDESRAVVPVKEAGEPAHGAEMPEKEGSEEEQYDGEAIEKTADLDSDSRKARGGMSLPRLVTSVVVVIVVVFLVWWFMIHRSINEKEGESKTAELVQKQLDVKEMKDRNREEVSSSAAEEGGESRIKDEGVMQRYEGEAGEPAGEPATQGEGQPHGEIVQAGEEVAEEGTPVQPESSGKPVTVTPAPEGSHYSVHVASFMEMSRAGSETDYLEKNGFDVAVIETEVKGQKWYRVYVGEYMTREEAAAARLGLLELPRVGYARIVTLRDN